MRLLIPLVVALSVVTAAPASAHQRSDVITGHSAELHPEGVTWDPVRNAFLLGSVRHGTVEVLRDGVTRTLAADPRMISTFGLHVAGTKLYVTYADMGLARRSTPDTTFKSSGLAVFDLFTGKAKRFTDLAIGDGPHAANDVAVDWYGNAYVTDIASDAIYKVDSRGNASVLVRDPRFKSPSIGLNGIAWHPAGYLLVGRYDTGTVFRVPLTNPAAFTEVALERPVVGADGVDLRPDGSLAVVTNNLGSPGENGVTVLRSRDNWRSARVTDHVAPWADNEPTTIARTPRGSYVLDGDLGKLLSGTGTSDTFTLRKLR